MADTKISALTAVTTPDGADEFAVNQSGTSKKVTLSQIRSSYPTLPSIISVGTEFTSTAIPTATLPATHTTNDILVLVIQTSNDSVYTAPSGYQQVGPQNGIGAAATAGSVKMAVFWKRDNGSEVAPTLTDAGDHTYGVMFAVRGCPTTGDPFILAPQSWKFTASTTGTASKGVTTADNSLVVNIFAHAIDSATAQASSPTNADLTSVTEQFDDATTDGTGGGITIISGVKQDAGDFAGTTVTWAASTVDVCTTLVFLPKDTATRARPAEIQTFIGSPSDLDDTWVKPSEAVKVFVQICDGGGSGSSGNTTTTAAGGGGGGGGGYDEAWFNAKDLAASITLHAGKGGAATTALNQAGNAGVLSQFDKGNGQPLGSTTTRITGTAATAAASADGGNGGCGSGAGVAALAAQTTRVEVTTFNNANSAGSKKGGVGGSGTTAPVGGSSADWGGGGGESGADTDAAITSIANGWSMRGGGGGSGGRTNTNISVAGFGGGAVAPATQGANGNDSTRLPYGGSGGNGGGSSVVTGGNGGFPGGGGGGGAGVAGGFGGAGGHGCVVVTTFFM